MTKNGNHSALNVTVLSSGGEKCGLTYEKRARGLVKKGRAVYFPDGNAGKVIRLTDCPTCENMEDNTMDNMHTEAAGAAAAPKTNYLFFDPKKWMKHPDTMNTTVFSRFFMNNPLGEGMKEVVSTGNWKWDWCEITNGMQRLERNTEYHFVFWLNGGENDNLDEICMLEIIFTDNSMRASEAEWEQRLCYKLNRSYIKPLKKYNGWELYDIPFTTNDCEYTQMRFAAQRAPMAIMEAKEPAFYAELEDRIDEFADRRPQRHNIVFQDGWPTNKWYATAALRGENTGNIPEGGFDMGHYLNEEFCNMDELCQRVTAEVSEHIAKEIDASEVADVIVSDYMEEILQKVKEKMFDVTK